MSDSERDAVIQIENLTRVYQMGETEVRALSGVSLEVKRNEYMAIMGPSGMPSSLPSSLPPSSPILEIIFLSKK